MHQACIPMIVLNALTALLSIVVASCVMSDACVAAISYWAVGEGARGRLNSEVAGVVLRTADGVDALRQHAGER